MPTGRLPALQRIADQTIMLCTQPEWTGGALRRPHDGFDDEGTNDCHAAPFRKPTTRRTDYAAVDHQAFRDVAGRHREADYADLAGSETDSIPEFATRRLMLHRELESEMGDR
jgi:hypothetical protein